MKIKLVPETPLMKKGHNFNLYISSCFVNLYCLKKAKQLVKIVCNFCVLLYIFLALLFKFIGSLVIQKRPMMSTIYVLQLSEY